MFAAAGGSSDQPGADLLRQRTAVFDWQNVDLIAPGPTFGAAGPVARDRTTGKLYQMTNKLEQRRGPDQPGTRSLQHHRELPSDAYKNCVAATRPPDHRGKFPVRGAGAVERAARRSSSCCPA